MCEDCLPTLVGFFEALPVFGLSILPSDNPQRLAVACDCGNWMPFCIEKIDGKGETVVDPCCFFCGGKIGSMPLDVYLLAMERKGCVLSCQCCVKGDCDEGLNSLNSQLPLPSLDDITAYVRGL